ncbi:DUF6515 family protein [Ancylomarina longa]|uniref:Uncharacterized protein n=1 Tax=Ancylomarina longa TaxID=2487017 RepID=A0A434AUB4_9BACT|nr:DUF6515 family protein [Ancylomarina longa]RUT77929.1 hypothetical protein DLK05_10640 [Ancylomarina longa]
MNKYFIRISLLLILLTGLIGVSGQAEAKRVYKKHVVVRHRRYRSYPAKGTVIVNVKSAHSFRYNKKAYYRSNGVFYARSGRGYKIIAAPIGFRLRTLPSKHVRILVHGTSYFYHYGTFYITQGNEYVVVLPPVGLQVDDLPDGYQIIKNNGVRFYVVDGVYYKKVYLRNGHTVFEVVKAA